MKLVALAPALDDDARGHVKSFYPNLVRAAQDAGCKVKILTSQDLSAAAPIFMPTFSRLLFSQPYQLMISSMFGEEFRKIRESLHEFKPTHVLTFDGDLNSLFLNLRLARMFVIRFLAGRFSGNFI